MKSAQRLSDIKALSTDQLQDELLGREQVGRRAVQHTRRSAAESRCVLTGLDACAAGLEAAEPDTRGSGSGVAGGPNTRRLISGHIMRPSTGETVWRRKVPT